MKELEQWLKGVEWNTKNVARLTDEDRAAFRKVEDRFNAWYKTLQPGQRESVDAIIKSTMAGLRHFGPNAKIISVDVPF